MAVSEGVPHEWREWKERPTIIGHGRWSLASCLPGVATNRPRPLPQRQRLERASVDVGNGNETGGSRLDEGIQFRRSECVGQHTLRAAGRRHVDCEGGREGELIGLSLRQVIACGYVRNFSKDERPSSHDYLSPTHWEVECGG